MQFFFQYDIMAKKKKECMMPKFFITNQQIKQEKIHITGSDVNHIQKVLRAKIGDTLEIGNTDTEENYRCEIENFQKDEIVCHIKENIKKQTEPEIKVTVFQGLPKADKMELIIQKSVELGVYDIVPVEMKRSIVKLTEKDKRKKQERWQKIAEVAAKQCGRDRIPLIRPIQNAQTIIQEMENYHVVLIAYEKEDSHTLRQEIEKLKQWEKQNGKNVNLAIVIGPEGGFAPEEVENLTHHGAKSITLGKRILRTETVAFMMLSIIMYELE